MTQQHVQPTRRSHQVSKFYLTAWSSRRGLIYRYDKATARWAEVSLKKQAGVVLDAFTQKVEDSLASTEQQAAPIIEQMRDSPSDRLVLGVDSRKIVATFMLQIHYRTMSGRERLLPILHEMSTDKHRPAAAKTLLDHARRQIANDPETVTSHLIRAAPGARPPEPLRDALVTSQWSLYRLSNLRHTLVTTDDPVLCVYGRRGGGFDHMAIPLSPSRLLVCRRRSDILLRAVPGSARDEPDADIIIRTYAMPARELRYTNLLLTQQARKHVFARRPVRAIEAHAEVDLRNWRPRFPDAPSA